MIIFLPSVNLSPSQLSHHAVASKTRSNTSHLTPLFVAMEADGVFQKLTCTPDVNMKSSPSRRVRDEVETKG